MKQAVIASSEHPVLIDRYLQGIEVEVDAISDGKEVLIPGIMEHIERAGVHSGDSIAVYPTQSLSKEEIDEIVQITTQLAIAMETKGLMNIQFVIHQHEVYVIEVNPRASRTVPFLSKVTQIPMANLATKIILGETLQSLGYPSGLWPASDQVAVKVPVFSFAKLRSVDVTLGPEMKSTGEVIGIDHNFDKALYKGLVAAGIQVPAYGTILATIADKDKKESLGLFQRFHQLGFQIMATHGTADFLRGKGIPITSVRKIDEGTPNILDEVRSRHVDLVINTFTKGKSTERDGFRIRRESVEYGIACFTSLDTAYALLHVLESLSFSLQPMAKAVNQR